MTKSKWLVEEQTESYFTKWRIKRVLHEEQTPFQRLQVVETEDFGRTLVLDDCVQTTVKDEFIYHEMIVHVPMNTHPNPERVLIVGGGDGGTAREVVRHEPVKGVDMVEIDEAVVRACKTHMPETAIGMEHPLVNLQIGDGIAWVQERANEYDVIIVDSSDPEGPAEGLFNQAFYQSVYNALKPGGIFVCQTLSPFFHHNLIRDIHQVVSGIFPITLPYVTVVPTYPSGFHSFMLGSKEHHPLGEQVRTPSMETGWYTAEMHRASFVLPPFFQKLLG